MYWYNCRKFIFQALISVAPLAAANAVLADTGKPIGKEFSTLSEEEKATKPILEHKRPFEGVSRYKWRIDIVCNLLARDGQAQAYYAILDKISARDEACPACRPLVTAFTSSCRQYIKTASPKRKRSATPTPVITRRLEPSTELLDEIGKLYGSFAEDTKINTKLLAATEKILAALRDPQGKAPIEKAYFGTLAEYMAAPFAELQAARKRSEEKPDHSSGSTPHEAPNADEMFE